MKEIILNKGYIAIVDDEDYEEVNKHKWHISRNGINIYAARNLKVNGKKTTIRMHRQIMGAIEDSSVFVDHKDHDGLNNQKSNLRKCNRTQNGANARKIQKCSSIYKGVSRNPVKGRPRRWMAGIDANKKRYFLGRLHTEREAALAYNKAAKELHGEFAVLNKIEDSPTHDILLQIRHHIRGRIIYDKESKCFFDEYNTKIAEMTSWGQILKDFTFLPGKIDLDGAANFQEQLGYFIEQAVNTALNSDKQ